MEELDLLEEYIAAESKEARKNAQLTELCDIIDEIRVLYPPLPASDFAEQTAERIAEKIAARQSGGKSYHAWFKTAGWASAAVAAVFLVTMGVLPSKPAEHLPPVPAPPIQQAAPSLQESSPALIEPGDIPEKQQAMENSRPKDNTVPLPDAENSKGQIFAAQSDAYSERGFTAIENGSKDTRVSMKSGALAVPGHLQTVRVLTDESVADMEGIAPFKVLTIPERTPMQVSIDDNPPRVTMIYKVDRQEITVRQWMQDATETSQAVPAPEQALLLRRGDVMVEVSGNADRAVLEEIAHSLQ